MGINPIRYNPWTGKRTSHLYRLYVIFKSVFAEKIRSKVFLSLLIIGIINVYVPPLITILFLPHESLTADAMIGGENPVIGPIMILYSMLIAALVSSDLISQDLSNRSFVLYFSRPIRPLDYLIGKMLGGYAVMSVFCLIPIISYGIVVIGTQSGTDYVVSLEVLGRAAVSGILTAIFFLGLGTMFSSVTKSRSYAGVGTFVSFFVLSLISQMFIDIDVNWQLINQTELLQFSYGMIFGNALPEELSLNVYWAILLSILIIPPLFAYWRIHRKAIGK
ncbi:MAG: ABC transporter permease subunit [Candidatus Peribacteraceae bacterium]|nr:ABC transporter permease subunit [Candidatus Peribacteraceae bacterium]